ncbi:MAG: flagellar export protein FliJ [Amphritea sp.]|nr:flagellar export protein FliJ [Amphritea sp.]
MKRSKRLQVVLDLAERRKQEADKILGEAQGRVSQGEQTLEQLQNYYNEYVNGFYTAGASGVSLGQIQNHQAFMQKLQAAIEQQRRAILMDKAQLERAREHWQAAYGRHKAMGSLVEKAKTEEQVQQEKQQQKVLDERSQLIRPPFI